jgi:outer membrane protein, heavy metal efflux system
MRLQVISSWAIATTVLGCAETTGARAHDAMIVALARSDHERASDRELALGGATLDRAALVSAVLARNPDLDAAREAWRAAAAGYPGAVSLDDPMASYVVAPFTIGARVPFSQTVELRQKLPWPGKRALAGAAVLADAEAAQADLETLRLDLSQATVDAFDDLYVVTRALEVNAHHRDLLGRIEQSAVAQYTVGHGSQQDPLEARVEIITLDRDRLILETQRRAAQAKINRLLRRRPDAELPAPPGTLAPAPIAPAGADLHPRQRAAAARIQARTSDLAHAERAFYPDLELMATYDGFWDPWQQRIVVGVGIEIPVQRDKRRAAVAMARAEQAKAAAELASVRDLVAEDRDRARREVDEATSVLALTEHQLLPTSHARVDAALAGFSAGQSSFTTVVLAEHAARGVELDLERARADLDRKIAALDRAEGRIAGGAR